MKKTFFVMICASVLAFGKPYGIDMAHSSVNFEVMHLGISKVNGSFDVFRGKIDINPKTKQINKFQGEVEINSINTKNQKRDNHLKSPDFFDSSKFKIGNFVMTKFENNKLYGNLTFRGITKPVVFDVAIYGPSITPSNKKEFMALELNGDILRDDFQIGGGFGDATISDKVKISILLEVRE